MLFLVSLLVPHSEEFKPFFPFSNVNQNSKNIHEGNLDSLDMPDRSSILQLGGFPSGLCSALWVCFFLLSLRIIFSASLHSGEKMSHFISCPSSNTSLKKNPLNRFANILWNIWLTGNIAFFCSRSWKGLSKLSEHRPVSYSARAAITKSYRLGGSNDRHLFLGSGGWVSQSKIDRLVKKGWW